MRHNDKWVEERRNQAAQFVRVGNRARNSVRFSSNETRNHASLKFEVCFRLAREGKDFITEAIFEHGGRADILVLDDHVIIECLESETEIQACSKCSSYPSIFAIEFAKFRKDKSIEKGIIRKG